MASTKERENFVYVAKLAEQAERYEGIYFWFFWIDIWPRFLIWKKIKIRCLYVVLDLDLNFAKINWLWDFECFVFVCVRNGGSNEECGEAKRGIDGWGEEPSIGWVQERGGCS